MNGAFVNSISELRGLSQSSYQAAEVMGYYSPGDGGGGTYWLNSGDMTSADNGGTLIVANDGGRWNLRWFGGVSAKQFGAKADAGVTDNKTALANAATWASSGMTQNELYFDAGIYGASEFPNFAKSHARIIARGEVRLRYTGTGNAIALDAGAGDQNVYGVTFGTPGNPFIVEVANSGAGHAVYNRGVHHSMIAVDSRSAGANGAGLAINFAVCNRYYTTCSVNEDGGFYGGLTPKYGILATQRNAGESTSYCRFDTPIVEGPTNGIYLDYCGGCIFDSGTAEDCVNGVVETPNAYGNLFQNLDFEANSTTDVTTYALQSVYHRCDSNTRVSINGNDVKLEGGLHSQIDIGGSALYSRLRDLRYNRKGNGSTISDSGVLTTKSGCVNYSSGYADGPNIAFGIAASGSGMTYKNDRIVDVDIVVSGGTVTQVTRTRGTEVLAVYSGASLGIGTFATSPGDILTFYWSTAPAAIVGFPRAAV